MLRPRGRPYHYLISERYALGYYRYIKKQCAWFARARRRDGRYIIKLLGPAENGEIPKSPRLMNFGEALAAADKWFRSPDIQAVTNRDDYRLPTATLCVCPIGKKYTVSHALSDFLSWHAQFGAPSNRYSLVSMANLYVVPLIGSVPCDELTAADVRSVALAVESTVRGHGRGVHRRQVNPTSLSEEARRKRRVTANHTLYMLRKALRMAFDEGRTATDHAWRSVRGFPHVEKGRVEHLSWTQAKKMVDAARPDLRRLILAALYTGCRVTELFKICAADIHDERMALYVHPSKSHRGRTIALPEEGYHFFKSLARGKTRGEPLFVRQDGSPWSVAYLASQFRPFVRSLGHSDGFVFYSLRHTYASLLLQAGTPPIVVARQLGHLTMMTVIRTYAHVADDFYDVELRQKYRPNFLTEPDLFSNSVAGDDRLRR